MQENRLNSDTKRLDIQYLRALAVIIVVVFHIKEDFLPLGYLGVDIFFVISGFVISRAILNRNDRGVNFDVIDFLIRRTVRLLPALFFTIIITIILAAVIYNPQDFSQMAISAIYAFSGLSNVYFFTQTEYFSAPLETLPLLHTWSLSVEEQFYVLFSVITFFTLKFAKSTFVFLLVWGFLFCGSLALYLADLKFINDFEIIKILELDNTEESFRFFGLPTRIYQLSIGILSAYIVVKNKFRFDQETALPLWILLTTLLILVVLFGGEVAVIEHHVNFAVSMITAIILIFGEGINVFGKCLVLKPIKFIGDISYSIYLVHWPLIVFSSTYFMRELHYKEIIVLVFSILILSVIQYVLFEKNNQRLFIKNDGVKHAFPIFMYSSFLCFGLLTFVITSNGLPSRLGDKEKLYEKFSENGAKSFHKAYYGGRNCKGLDKSCGNIKNPQLMFGLIGDSHAKQYFSGLSALFPDAQFNMKDLRCRLLNKYFCINSRHNNKTNIQKKIKTWDEIACDEEAIFVGQLWRVWKGGAVSFNEKTPISFVDLKSELDFHKLGLSELSKNFPSCKFVVFGEVPKTNKIDVMSCLFSPLDLKNCYGNNILSSEQKRYLILNKEIESFLTNYSNILFINPYRPLCDEEGCKNVINNKPLYSDNNHLSVWGGKHVINYYKNEIINFVETNKCISIVGDKNCLNSQL